MLGRGTNMSTNNATKGLYYASAVLAPKGILTS
jgi:hypothetical protein